MIANLNAGWAMAGVVMEKRELTSSKNANWRGYVFKLATLGNTFELNVTQDQHAGVTVGEQLEVRGRFEEQSGRLKLIAERISKATTQESTKPVGTR